MRWRSALVVLMVLPLAACVAAPRGVSSWKTDADLAVGEAISGLGTAQLVVTSRASHDLPLTYARVTLNEAVSSMQKELTAFAVSQPPDRLHAMQQQIMAELERASTLLVRVRTGYSSPPPSQSELHALAKALKDELDRLDKLQTKVEAIS